MSIAFFDFDGTITRKDSLGDFIKYATSRPKYYLGIFILSPILIAYIFKIVPNYRAKEILISYFFKGWSIEEFKTIADSYSLNQIDNIISYKALEKIEWHKEQNHKVVVVSASIYNWLDKWCRKNSINLIATELEVKSSRLTGKFLTKNCYGEEKVRRIKELYNLDSYETIYVYGDSRGDREMLSLSSENKSFYKIF